MSETTCTLKILNIADESPFVVSRRAPVLSAADFKWPAAQQHHERDTQCIGRRRRLARRLRAVRRPMKPA